MKYMIGALAMGTERNGRMIENEMINDSGMAWRVTRTPSGEVTKPPLSNVYAVDDPIELLPLLSV